jgi:hypothetical protein
MKIRFVVGFAAACALAHGATASDGKVDESVWLKNRRYQPAPQLSVRESRAEIVEGPSGENRRYLMIHFRDMTVLRKSKPALEAAGVTFFHFIPKSSVSASVPADFDLGAFDGIIGVEAFQPGDRVARQAGGRNIVEFFPDVSPQRIREIVADAGAVLHERPLLPAHVVYAVMPDEGARDRLARHSEVAWIMPAADAVIEDHVFAYCPGSLSSAGIHVANYATNGPGWDGTGLGSASLSYYFGSGTGDLTLANQRAEIVRALNTWSAHVQINFSETASPNQNRSIDIAFVSGSHGDGSPFDGQFGVLAHCFYPSPPNPETIAGDMHFDDAESWRIGGSGNGSNFDLYSVALHEFGHGLGLDHSSDPAAVMYATISTTKVHSGLHTDDINGIRSLYAARGASTPTNDNFSSASTITLSGSSTTVTGSNTGATKQSGEPSHGGNTGGASVWWRWTAPGSGTVTLTTTGSTFDTLLAVYTGSSVSALTRIVENDDAAGLLTSSVTFSAVSGTTYYFAVDGYNGATGSISLNLSSTVGNRPPTASFSLSSHRQIGQTLSISVTVGDPDGNYSYANLWVRTPTRGWVAIRSDNSQVVTDTLSAANSVATSAGTVTRTFPLTLTDGPGSYTVALSAVDTAGARGDATSQSIVITQAAAPNQPPLATFSLSGHRQIGQTLSITVDLSDPDNNYSYANLWVRTPTRGWVAIRSDNSQVVSDSLSAANTVASTTGTFVRSFPLTSLDGPGSYMVALSAMDAAGLRGDAVSANLTIVPPGNNSPTASFTLSGEREVGQAITATINVGDPDNNYSYSNFWVRSPTRGWLAIKEDNSQVASDSLVAANTVARSAGVHTRTFSFTPADGPGNYLFALAAVDAVGLRTDAPSVVVPVSPRGNNAPTASFTLSGQRQIEQSISISVAVGDPDGNYSYANLWVRTPTRGWVAIRADNSQVVSDSLSASNTVATAAGSHTRVFPFTTADGPGVYTFALTAMDAAGRRTDAPVQTITVSAARNNAPTAAFSLSGQRQIGQTITATLTTDDPDNDFDFANLWVRTPTRGWVAIRADGSQVVSGDLSSTHAVATTAGTHVRTFAFTPTDGPGSYLFALTSVDRTGLRTDAPAQILTIGAAGNNAPTAAFTVSGERQIGQTITATIDVGDPDNDFSYANLWVRTPNRGWLAVRADGTLLSSGDLSSTHAVATAAGRHARSFAFTPADGPGSYLFALTAVDRNGLRTDAPTQLITVGPAGNNAPTASFSLSGQRQVGQTITATINVGDPDGNFSFANLWVRTPARGWVAIKADNSQVVSDALSAANTVASAPGTYARTFAFTPTDGPGNYTFALAAQDSAGLRTDAPSIALAIGSAGNNAPTAAFSVSGERQIGQTLSINLNVGDPDGNYSYANLWVRTPSRGWVAIRADNSQVASDAMSASHNVAPSAGSFVRSFALSASDGPGTYLVALSAVDSAGARTDTAPLAIVITPAGNNAPTASFTLSGQRTIGQTLTVNVDVGDPDGNYSFANLWIRSPNRGWIAVKADNSQVLSDALSSSQSVANSTGTHVRTFPLASVDGPGVYLIALSAVDSAGARTDAINRQITVINNRPPQASFSVSSARTIGQTLVVALDVNDPDGDLAFANLWVNTPGRGWMAITADNSLVATSALSSAHTVANSAGAFVRTLPLSILDGVGTYTLALASVDSAGQVTFAPNQYITVSASGALTSGEPGAALPETYAEWAARHFTPLELTQEDISAPAAINGSDGMTNLLKYALGVDPKADGRAAVPDATNMDDHWFYTYRRPGAISDLIYRVEVSEDLTNWTDFGVTQEVILSDGNWQTWQAHYHGDGDPIYFRLVPAFRATVR